MAASESSSKRARPRRPPATTIEGREQQIIAAAMDEVERQIRAGKASSQVLTHFIRLASTREQLEQDKLRRENKLLDAKVDAIESSARVETLYQDAIVAMRMYQGRPPDDAETPMLHRAQPDR